MSSVRRRHRHSALAAAFVVGVMASVLLSVPPAHATPAARQVSFSEVAATTPGRYSDSATIGRMVVDGPGERGFIADESHGEVVVYDVSGESFAQVAVIGGILSPAAIAVDDTLQRVYVLSRHPSQAVVSIDIDPDSPLLYTVLSSTPAGGAGAERIAVDPGTGVVYVVNRSSGNAAVVDTVRGSSRLVPTGAQPGDVVVDPDTHTAYVPSPTDQTITSIGSTGSVEHRVNTAVARLGVVANGLVAASSTPVPHLEVWDTTSWKRTVSSDALESLPDDLAVDPKLKVVYTVDGALRAFRLESLQREDGMMPGEFFALSLDLASHRLFASAFSSPYRVAMLKPNLSPLPSVDRNSGSDRFAVSASTSEDAFLSGPRIAYIASGGGFADALSGAAAAGKLGGPILLVSKDAIPDSVGAELKRLQPQRIVLLGGEDSVSNAVQTALGRYSRSVIRIGGPDRYEVSAAVSRATFGVGIDSLYIASGEKFPDALSGSAVAGRDGSPVLLVRHDGIPAAVVAEIARLNPAHIIVLGGTDTISDGVVAALSSRPTVRIDGADRFAVSAALAELRFARGAFTVYVASGEVFSDALSAGAAAISNDAPVLLVTRDSMPAHIQSVLKMLHPYRIVIVGGPSTVSDAVAAVLEQYLPR